MRKEKYSIVEELMIYLAERSVEKSVPVFSIKSKKPKKLKAYLKEINSKGF